jgi:hypothetical protein
MIRIGISIFLLMCSTVFQLSCKKSSNPAVTGPAPDDVLQVNAPPLNWQEHWFEHNQLVTRVYYDSILAVYYDKDVSRTINWPFSFIKDVWQYTRKTYGYNFGTDPRLFAIFHTGKYSGGHPAYYYDAGYDNRNVIDCGSSLANAWAGGSGNDLDLVTHEVGHIVEGAANGTKGSPAFSLWKDSKWMEIYIYDVYKGLGKTADADRWFNMMNNTVDNFPRANTQWFKNWFYPVYNQHGGSQVLNKFFKLLAAHFPKDGNQKFTRDMNWGEFIHFWSGAAGANLKGLATTAFGWPASWETEFNNARTQFNMINY